jgi:predicted site-specific integrase-resolvase
LDEQTEEIISAAEFARRLGVDRSAIRRYVLDGKLTAYSNEYQGLKPQPRFLASDVDRIRAMRPESSEAM